MYILGVQGISHDTSACLLKDGAIVAAVEEERFVGAKHTAKFPVHSIRYCLKEAGITLEEVDYLASGWASPWTFFKKTSGNVFRVLRKSKSVITEIVVPFVTILNHNRATKLLNRKIECVEHHMAHAASAYHCSGFKEGMVMTLDGRGEADSGFLGFYDSNGVLDIYKHMKLPNSLGHFYGGFTEYLGFRAMNGEGKVMGLAPYGSPSYDLSDIIDYSSNLWLNNDYFGGIAIEVEKMAFHLKTSCHEEKLFTKRFGKPRKKDGRFNKRYEDIAASVQAKTEEIAVKMLSDLSSQYNSRTLLVSGGVGLNCVMNGKLLQSDYIDDIYIQPAASDAGVSIGAAFYLYHKLGYKSDFVMDHAYWGPSYSNEYIKEYLDAHGIHYEEHDDIAGVSAELIAKGKVLAWFQGRMEMGPRALGNRSILADPRKAEMKDILNFYVKHREPYRPFCPSLLEEAADEYLEDAYPSPFMILTFMVREKKQKEVPAITHVDGTARPQTVSKKINPLYWRLIKSFEEETSVPVIINTSFNIKGQPIVRTPRDAVKTFFNTGIEYLSIGNFLLDKSRLPANPDL